MTGGGARGAYQAGVLKRIGEIKSFDAKKCPFDIIGAASAGAVNAAAVAYGAHDFSKCTRWLSRLWAQLSIQDIYRTDLGSLVPKAGQWIKDLSFGAFLGGSKSLSLLDAAPLREFLMKRLRGDRISNNIKKGNLESLVVSATNYSNGKTYLFVESSSQENLWSKRRQVALSTKITVEHIFASAAIPMVFSPVKLQTQEGVDFYGDGCLRLIAPLSPVIRLNANKLLAIGVRTENPHIIPKEDDDTPPPLAQILGTALNAIFLDHLETDVDHLKRLNNIISKVSKHEKDLAQMDRGIKVVDVISISPSQDLGKIAEDYAHRLPTAVRYLLSGLGSISSASDLMSYLLFDSNYTQTLIDLGYQDTNQRIDEIENFLRS